MAVVLQPAGHLFPESMRQADMEASQISKQLLFTMKKKKSYNLRSKQKLKEDVVLNTDVKFRRLQSCRAYRADDDLKVVNAFGQENVKPKTTEQTTMDNGELTSMLHKASWNVIRLMR